LRTKIIILILLILTSFCALAQNNKDNKSIITVLNFSTNGVSEHEMKALISLLSSALFQTGKYTVIDVSERDRLLKEMEFSASECTEESCQLQMGRMLSAESIVVGNITKVGTRYVLSAKILETETARTQNTSDGIYPTLDAMLDDIFTLANKLAKNSSVPVTTPAPTPTPAITRTRTEPKVTPAPTNNNTPATTEKPKTEKSAETERKGYTSLRVKAGVALPIGSAREIFKMGVPVNIGLEFNADRSWGELSLFFDTGSIYQPTQDDVRYQYNLIMFPLTAGFGYKTKFAQAFYLTAQVSGGIIFYLCNYHEDYAYRDNGFYMDPFANLGLGAGFRLSATLDLGLLANAYMVFYDGGPALSASPTAYLSFKF
jgi:hypothetical protein